MQLNKKVIVGIVCLAVFLIGAGAFYVYKMNLASSIVNLRQATSAVMNDMIILENVYRDDIAPLILQLQPYIVKKDYKELVNLEIKIKDSNKIQKKRLVILSADFENLAVMSKTASDSETKNFIETGKNIVKVYTAYSALVDAMLFGKTSSQSATEAKNITSNFAVAAASFRDATTKLILKHPDYFTQAPVNGLKTVPMASSTKSR